MAISEDVLQLVSILAQAGFPVLAGEILTEIGLGKEVDDDRGRDVELEGDLDYRGQRPLRRTDIPEERQLSVALEMIQLRLAEPMKRYAEAESIAGRLSILFQDTDKTDPGEAEPIPIVLVPESENDEAAGLIERQEPPGHAEDADALLEVLERIRESLD